MTKRSPPGFRKSLPTKHIQLRPRSTKVYNLTAILRAIAIDTSLEPSVYPFHFQSGQTVPLVLRREYSRAKRTEIGSRLMTPCDSSSHDPPGSGIEQMLETLQCCSRLDFLATPSLGDAKKVFLLIRIAGFGRNL
jgi:hypothetical protein